MQCQITHHGFVCGVQVNCQSLYGILNVQNMWANFNRVLFFLQSSITLVQIEIFDIDFRQFSYFYIIFMSNLYSINCVHQGERSLKHMAVFAPSCIMQFYKVSHFFNLINHLRVLQLITKDGTFIYCRIYFTFIISIQNHTVFVQ